MCDSPFFLCEKICKHRGDVIVGWNCILSLKYSHFPCPLQWQITEQAHRALQYTPARDPSPGPLAVSHALEMIKRQFASAPFTVGNSVLLCPHRGANGRENSEGHSSKGKRKLERITFPLLRATDICKSKLFINIRTLAFYLYVGAIISIRKNTERYINFGKTTINIASMSTSGQGRLHSLYTSITDIDIITCGHVFW